MGRDLSIAGLCLSRKEWINMEESSRLLYLQAFIETSPPGADQGQYEAYELSIDLA